MWRLDWTNEAPNPEHLSFLSQGVDVWNHWREMNLQIIPSLHKANLSKANLNHANFNKAQFKEANLSGANLKGSAFGNAILIKANLSNADLSGVNFYDADLSEADLTDANLSSTHFNNTELNKSNFSRGVLFATRIADSNGSQVNFSNANFKSVDIQRTNFSEADFSYTTFNNARVMAAKFYKANFREAVLNSVVMPGAYLYGSEFVDATLKGIDLSGANLSNADLSGANLSNANLSDANLSNADLRDANLSNANLSDADLSNANFQRTVLNEGSLVRVKAIGTDFTGAKFTGVCLEDWYYNYTTKLNEIDCEYIYRNTDKDERYPITKDFAPGEFTKLYQKALETVDLIFTDGIDWKAFLLSFQELEAEYGEEKLSVQAIEKKSGGAFLVRLEVSPEANKADIERQTYELYNIKLNALEATYHGKLQAKDEQIAIYRQQNASLENVINILGNRPIQNIINVTANAESNSMSESYQSKYDQRNSNNQFVDTAQSGSNLTFNQQNFSQNINQNIDDITRLINSLREKAQEFPQDKREEVLVHLDDLQEDINKPEKQKPERIKTRIIALITIAGTVFGVVANSADFTNNVLEIADKLGIPIPTEISQPQRATQQLPPTSH